MKTHWFTFLLGLFLVLALAACSTKNVGLLDSGGLSDGRDVAGLTLGDFEVIRCDAGGSFDASLNSTMDLRLTEGNALVISVGDSELTGSVAVEVRYDASRLHASDVEFHGLLGNDPDVITGSFLNINGKSGIGQVVVGDNAPESLNGDFATVYFAAGPSRNISAAGPHVNSGGLASALYPDDENLENFVVEGNTTGRTVTATWYGSWHLGDNNQDKLVTIGDITPIGFFFNDSKADTWACVRTDSNRDGIVSIIDLTQIGFYYDQGTDGYLVEVSDDTEGATRTEIGDITWGAEPTLPAEQTMFSPPGDVVAGQIETTFNMWQVEVNDGSTPQNYAALEGIDDTGNDNNRVRIWVTPYKGTDTSATGFASADVQVTGGGGGEDDVLLVQDFEIQIAGAVGGIGATSDIFNEDNTDVSAGANTSLTFALSTISGTFEAVEFDGNDLGNLPEGMTQEIYDDAFDAVRDSMTWNMSTEGAAGFRRTVDAVVTLDTGSWPATGDPGAGMVFPDDDPESTGNNAEAALNVNMPNVANQDMGTWVLNQIAAGYSFAVDVDVDAAAPVVNFYGSVEVPITELNLNEPTMVPIDISWGGTGEDPADLTLTSLELHKIDTGTGLSAEIAETLTYTEEMVPVDGEYTVRTEGDPPITSLLAYVIGTSLDADSSYAFRIYSGTVWSSINKPQDMLATKPPPPPQDLMELPDYFVPEIDIMQVFYGDPVIRQNPGMWLDTFQVPPVWTPDDQTAWDDILKLNGDEFVLGVGAAGAYPRIATIAGTNPASIQSLDDNEEVGIIIIDRNKSRMVVDVGWVTYSGNPGDPDRNYAYKMFTESGTPVGQGTFVAAPMGVFSAKPVGKNWGVNVFNREERELADREYTNFVIIGDNAQNANPAKDVLWFEIAGGWMFDWDQDATGVYQTPDFALGNNVLIKATDNDNMENHYMSLGLSVIGLTALGDYIAIHIVTADDFDKAGAPGWAGKFDPGHNYTLELDDKHWAGVEWTFDTNFLTVSGNNPHDL